MAVRRAVATGLHKGAPSCRSQSSEEIAYHETLFWCLYFLETWGCFTIGRPSSVPEPDPSLPLPKEGSFLNALVKLSKIMKDCVSSIYMARHDSIVPVWHAATEIKGRLQRLAEDELKELAFGAGEPFDSTEKRGSQAFLSAMYHHVIILTFRPFIIMRTKLRNEMAKKKPQSSKTLQQLLPWLDQGAAYLLLLDMLQDAQSAEKNKAWILTGLDCMRLIAGNCKGTGKQCAVTVAAIEQMLQCVFPTGATNNGEVNKPYPDVRRADVVRQRPPTTRAHLEREPPQQPLLATWPGPEPAFDDQHAPAWIYPSMPFGPGIRSQPTDSPNILPGTRPTDGAGMEFLSAEAGLDLSFGNTDIEAFLSLDPNLTFDFGL
ncbi:hypothetical protein N3K66_008584 [Trichothecium roseum]|uniref:Uncharacterized protein n=1 Tax=Trichothecium roseum TaxID=47278 RepID=A0ACC0USB9_9HYPO|nr:hypothetical protein N3K66_008584 [Trichothecium roseum]